ncbi:hypothetical protein BDD12DRAFT_728731 [Trichophaea hybrida]|nr:hypothetical protein BDD12DRAFT_733329 [Trichophaea hybrida]KAF8542461.1 hypothetical protein BDD12DRAFT_728731 [Trichophaea hybrida]
MVGQHDLPIPTYEEATSSRAASDYGAENDTLLQQQATSSSRRHGRNDGYRPPTVESVRSSIESSFLEEFASPRSSAESLQREMIQMEVMEGGDVEGGSNRGSGYLRLSFSKRFSSISSSLSAISLPRNPFRGIRFRIPSVPCCANLDSGAMVPIYRLLAVLFALIVVYILLANDAFNFRGTMGSDYLGPFDPESVRTFAQKEIDKGKIRHWLDYISSFDHMAGTEGDYVLAKYVQGEFSSFGLRTQRMRYDVYLNYPQKGGRRVWMDEPKWEAVLEEPVVNKKHQNTLVFHGHSKSGSAKGPIIYANYGSREDFKALESQGVNVKGAIVLMREGGTQKDRGLKIKAAEDKGAVGALLFTDPKTEGWDWPDSAVQRGDVGLMSWVVGDVLTPDTPAIPESHQVSKVNNKGLVNIPSLPLSYKDARPLLLAIKGKGKKVNDTWVGGVPQIDEYWTGSIDSSPTVNLKNEQVERDRQPIWNILGEVEGVDKLDEKIIIGSSRDAWCFGASDPNSGTVIMLEVARIFGKMMEFGWRPKRGVIFASWDAVQFNLIGPTEFIEEAGDGVRDSVFAYINLDAAITGTHFTASGSPAMQSVMNTVLGRVRDPVTHKILNSTWAAQDMPGPGVRGAYVPFQYHAGISSIDISFSGKGFPYHSCYDNFAWMKDIMDPTFMYHETLTKIVTFLLLELSDTEIIPLSMSDYVQSLDKHTKALQSWVTTKAAADTSKHEVDLSPLTKAIATAQGYITKFTERKEGWMEQSLDGTYTQNDDWAVANRRSRGLRMGNFDKHLSYTGKGGGLPGREWFKHLVLSPQTWGGTYTGYFPSIRDAIDEGDWELAQKEVQKVANIIEKASRKLLDESTLS